MPSSGSRRNPSTNNRRASPVGNAAGAQVEQRRFVEVADCRPVAAFHVVGKDFELWLRIDRRARAENQIAAHLVRIDLLRARSYRDAALKCAMGTVLATPLNISRVSPPGAA